MKTPKIKIPVPIKIFSLTSKLDSNGYIKPTNTSNIPDTPNISFTMLLEFI
jgi:hypothetical protein